MKGEIQKAETGITAAQIETLAKASVIPAGLPADILQVFMITCNQHGLSPFKKEIYLIPYKGKYSAVVGIDGLRAKAARTDRLAGRDDAKFDLMPDGTFKTAAQLAAVNKKPLSCTVTVYRAVGGMRCPFSKTVLFAEYCPAKSDEWSKWNTMPFNQIEKCAEAAALRMAFADETAGLNVEEESAAMQDITIQAASQNPAVAVDEKVLEDRVSKVFNKHVLWEIYNENPAHKTDFAHIFSNRQDEIKSMIEGGQMTLETWEAKPEKTIAI